MRVLVTGGRDYQDTSTIWDALAELPGDAVIVHGDARGLDSLAAAIADQQEKATEAHPADWSGPCRDTCTPRHRRWRYDKTICPAAGNYRNQEMVDAGADLVLAFPGGTGTADCVRRAKAAGIEVREVR